MKFAIIAVVSSLAAAGIAAQNPIPNQPNPPFFGGDKGKKDKGTTRPVHGVVKDNLNNAIPQAIVELKNVKNGKKIETVTHQDGTYRFDDLNISDDYELWARHDQLTSPVKKLSMYDSRKDPVINFDLEPKKEALPAPKQ
jgi:Carboxypeptidase regulatory-like domain